MREDFYNKDYRQREYDRFSDLDQKPKKKTSFLTVLLVGLLVLLVCSLGYDNIIKPYLEKRAQQTESPVASSSQDNEESAVDEADDITSIEDDEPALEVIEEPIQRSLPVTTEQAERKSPTAPANPSIEHTTKPTESSRTVQPEQSRRNTARTQPNVEDESELSTSEILERRTHANVVRQAQRAGVSTEGTTSEILERITHANVVKQARRAGVSTEGSTSDILERITHANVVKQARQAGVSTEGSTSEILERITRKNLQRMGY